MIALTFPVIEMKVACLPLEQGQTTQLDVLDDWWLTVLQNSHKEGFLSL